MTLLPRLAACAVVLCTTAAAQESSPLNWSVIRGYPKFGGTYRLATGQWVRGSGHKLPGRPEGGQTRVYDNTCLWTGNAANNVMYAILEDCERVWDDGRIPGTSSGIPGATDDNMISSVTFGHVTFAPVGTVDVELAFYNALGGACAGFNPPNPPAPRATGAIVLNPGVGVTLPGDSIGTGTGWFINIDLSGGDEFCLLSEGDGTSGSGSDNFTWSFRHGNPSAVVGGGGGPIIAGEPVRGVFGACTYSLACGSDPLVGACGTGLDASDAYWGNVDGDPAGPAGTINTSLVCSGAATGTGCFFFGGWPANAWASFFLQIDSAGPCAAPIEMYCTGKTNSIGCVPFITTTGTPSTVGTAPFRIVANDVLPGEAGFLLYSCKKANLNFHGGKLCVKAPFTRALPPKTGKAGSGGCSGATLSRNFNKTIQSGNDPTLTPGKKVYAQWFQRDPNDPAGFGDALTNAVCFTISGPPKKTVNVQYLILTGPANSGVGSARNNAMGNPSACIVACLNAVYGGPTNVCFQLCREVPTVAVPADLDGDTMADLDADGSLSGTEVRMIRDWLYTNGHILNKKINIVSVGSLMGANGVTVGTCPPQALDIDNLCFVDDGGDCRTYAHEVAHTLCLCHNNCANDIMLSPRPDAPIPGEVPVPPAMCPGNGTASPNVGFKAADVAQVRAKACNPQLLTMANLPLFEDVDDPRYLIVCEPPLER